MDGNNRKANANGANTLRRVLDALKDLKAEAKPLPFVHHESCMTKDVSQNACTQKAHTEK